MSYKCSILDIHLLAPDILSHDAALADALAEVEAVVNDTNVEGVIRDLLSKPGLLEFILSGKCDNLHFVSCSYVKQLLRRLHISRPVMCLATSQPLQTPSPHHWRTIYCNGSGRIFFLFDVHSQPIYPTILRPIDQQCH